MPSLRGGTEIPYAAGHSHTHKKNHASLFGGQTLLTALAVLPAVRRRLSPPPSLEAPGGHVTRSGQSEVSGN